MSTLNRLATDSRIGKQGNSKPAAHRGDQLWRGLTIVVLVVIAIIMLMPFIFLVTSSLKSQMQIFQYPPQWIPDPIRWDNYVRALTLKPFGLYFKNTLVICV